MMNLKYILLLALFFLVDLLLFAQITTFNKIVPIPDSHDYGYAIVPIEEENAYLIASNSVCEFPEGTLGCIVVTKVDSLGEKLWHKRFTAFPNDFSIGGYQAMIRTQDGGVAIVGDIYGPTTEYDACLLKLNTAGDSLWLGRYTRPARGFARNLCETPDGGFALAATVSSSSSFGSGHGDVHLIRTNAQGELLWEKAFGGTSLEEAVSVAVDHDGGFILGAFSTSFGFDHRNGYIIKTDSLGNEIWHRLYGVTAANGACTVMPLQQDNGYLMKSGKDTLRTEWWEDGVVYVARLDSVGQPIWETYFNRPKFLNLNSMRELADGSFIFVGTDPNFIKYGSSSHFAWMMKMSSTGKVLWERLFTYPYSTSSFYLKDIVPTITESGFMITGEAINRNEDGLNADIWLLKVDSMGCLTPGCQNFDTPCHSFADTMEISTGANTVLVCHQDTLQVATRQPILMEGDTLLYALHHAAGTNLRQIETIVSDGRFTFMPDTLSYLKRYYASAFVAPLDHRREVMIEHSCTSVAKGTHTIFLPPIDLHAQTICDTTTGEARVQIQLTGGAPSYNADQYHYQLTASNGSITELVLTDTLLIPAVADQDTLRFTVSDEVGCVQELSYVVACPRVTSVATIARPPQPLLSISPNPIQQQAMLRISTPSSSSNLSHTIQVHDVTGKIVQQYTLAPQQQQVLLDRGDLPDGMYFCTLHQAGNLLDQVKILLIK